MVTALETYFRGEKGAGIFVLLASLVALCAFIYLWKAYRAPLGHGMMIPLGLLILLGLIGGPILHRQSSQRIKTLGALAQKDPKAFVSQELPRIQKVNANWIRIKLAWAIISLLCLGVLLFVKRDFWLGVALGFLLICSTLMVLDTFAEKRALVYQAQLIKLSP